VICRAGFLFSFSFPPSFSWRSRAVIVRGGGAIGSGSGGGGGKDMWLIKLFFGKFLEPLEVGSWHQQETLTRLMLVWREGN